MSARVDPPVIEDASEADFAARVIEASRRVPVVVDFWAPWCGPCRMLGPILERLAAEGGGAWRLVKVNVDDNPSLATRYGVQGIPAVKAFKGGQVAAEFVGAQPEPRVRDFLRRIVPDEGGPAPGAARAAEAAGEWAAAEAGYREALGRDPANAAALLGLGRALLGADRILDAEAALGRVPHGSPERAEADRLAAQARFRREAALTGGEIEARRRIGAYPDDLAARLALATALAARGAYREALEGLLEVVGRPDAAARERARQATLEIFRALGEEHALTREYRPRLGAALW